VTNARTARSTRDKAAELRAQAARQEARRRNILVAAVVAAVLVVIVGVVILVQTLNHDQQAKVNAASAPPANLVDGAFVVGNSSAKVTIDLYEDFLCPACNSFEKANAAQLKAWADAGTAKLAYRPVAILDQQSQDRYSTRSLNAAAAVIAVAPKSFPKFHELLFANQPPEGGAGLTDDQLVQFAVQAGAPQAAVRDAVTKLTYQGWTAKTTEDFSKKGYNSTPTIVVNGTKIEDWSPDKLKAAVEKAAG
jgi:protein-disulfide isomerase